MSYLVDALRKAEHERRQGVAADVAALSPRLAPAARSGLGGVGGGIVVLALCNVVLFGYLLWPRANVQPSAANRDDTTTVRVQAEATTAANDTASALRIAAPQTTPDADSGPQPQPVDHDTMLTPTWPDSQKAVMAQPARPPDVQIHGHLFSADPSESFILVDGRIYHEGEHLPDGVAVMRIDKKGALLGYRGQRFHVNGPG